MSELVAAEMPQDAHKINELAQLVDATHELTEAARIAEGAGKLRAWLKIVKAAADARIAAVRLECIALRKVAQLWAKPSGRPDGMTPGLWSSARSFAALEDEEFSRLLETLTSASAPSSLYQQVRERFEREERDRRRAAGYESFVTKVVDEEDRTDQSYAARGLRKSATELINSLHLDGATFTVMDAALTLGDALSEDDVMAQKGDWRDSEIQSMLRDLIRRSIPMIDAEPGPIPGIPDIITYHDEALGWVRVPARSANLSHLLAMVALRQSQAEQARASAAELTSAADEIAMLLREGEDYSVPISELTKRHTASSKEAPRARAA